MNWKSMLTGCCFGAGLLLLPEFDSHADLIMQSRQFIAQNVTAQKTAEKADDEGKKKLKGRLPNNYGKIGITSEQRQKIYAIQAKYRAQMAELQEQIRKLRKQRDDEVHGVLTDTQKKELADLKAKSSKKTATEKK